MATEISTERLSVPPRRLWFGLTGSVAAWVALGIVNILIEWRTCMRYGQPATPAGHVIARAVCVAIGVVLLVLAIVAGVISYRNWRRLSDAPKLGEALGTDRREFMAMMGMFVSVTMGIGIVWLSLVPLIITACERAK